MAGVSARSAVAMAAMALLAVGGVRAAATSGNGKVCTFALPPETPYYWDEGCKMGELGCWADGVHAQCRFCGEAPYTGIPCPRHTVGDAATPSVTVCRFPNWPTTPVFWDSTCKDGDLGCKADGEHLNCRFCGSGVYSEIPCPAEACIFANPPTTPYYWDPDCAMGKLGCMADGIHAQCRFCAARPYESIACPEEAAPKSSVCWFPNEPKLGYYWEPSCKMGMLGCWADGIHAECRFCGGDSVYAEITCPKFHV